MDVPLIVAGGLGILGAAVHGAGGEVLVVRKLSRESLPSSRFGGPGMTKAMIHAAWHMTTVAFLSIGVALLVAGLALEGDAAKAIGVLGAVAFTGFAAVAGGLGVVSTRSVRPLFEHPGPAVLAATAALAWVGAFA